MSKQHLTKLQVSDRFFTPDVIGRNGMSVYDCLSEFIANSFDWCITKKNPEAKTIIQILLNPKSIEIVDNGVGMNLKELSSAINIAESSDLIRDKINDFEERKGMYGMGMKVSALSLGWKFTITTISIEDPNTELVFEFDSHKLLNEDDYSRDTLITEEYEKRVDSPLKNFTSGTHIKIENLVKRLPDINLVQGDLRERFSPDINNLMESDLLDFSISDSYGSKNTIGKFNITYNFEDEVLKLDFENPNQWASEKAYTYTGSNGKQFQLRGFLQLLNKRSFQGKFGLNLYCKGQLIERYHKKIDGLFSTAGRAAEKTYGELHLDGLNPDYVKSKGFIEDAAFKEVAKLIAKDLEFYKYLGIATNAANDRIKQEINKRKGIGGVIEPDFEDEDEDEEEIEGDEGENVETPEDPTEIEDENQKNVIVIDKKLKIEINAPYVNVNALDAKNKLSRECYYSKSRVDNNLWIIQVYLNPESALYKSFESLYDNYSDKNKAISLLKKITICESIFDKLISEHKYKEELARKITDLKVYPKVLKLNLS